MQDLILNNNILNCQYLIGMENIEQDLKYFEVKFHIDVTYTCMYM